MCFGRKRSAGMCSNTCFVYILLHMPSAQHSGKSVIRAGISKETSLLLLAGGQGSGEGGGGVEGKGWHETGQNIRLFLCTRPVFLSMHTYLLYKLPTSCTYLHTVHDSTGYTYTQTNRALLCNSINLSTRILS